MNEVNRCLFIMLITLALFNCGRVSAEFENVSEAELLTSQARGAKLNNGETLHQGQHMVSPNGRWRVYMQHDGNVVLYEYKGSRRRPIWVTDSDGKGKRPYRMIMQGDGNLVVYDRNKTATWSSDTWNKGTAPYHLIMQDDQNLVLYDRNNKPIWASKSSGNTSKQTVDTLSNDRILDQNGFLTSKNGKYYARLQDDGNFVCYSSNNFNSNNAFWASQTGGKGRGPYKLVPQTDGNLCLYDSNGTCTWSSNTWNKGTAPFKLVMQDDRNLVLYDRNNSPTWASGTNV